MYTNIKLNVLLIILKFQLYVLNKALFKVQIFQRLLIELKH